jgi:septum formation protein
MPMRLVLASRSPRRLDLLTAAGVEVDADPVEVDESQVPGEPPDTYVDRVARLKAAAGAARHPGRTVIGADTAVVVQNMVLGKPTSRPAAAHMLGLLSGRDHEVLTGVAVARDGQLQSFVERTVVTMRALTPDEVQAYLATGEPMDKAGAYAIQGGAAGFITGIQGSYSNVVGLPVERLMEVIRGAPGPLAPGTPDRYNLG